MNPKTVIFEGGPLDNQFRTLPSEEVTIFNYIVMPVRSYKDLSALAKKEAVKVEYETKQYVATNKYYGGIQVFVPREDFDKGIQMIKNESNTEVTKAG